MTDWPSGARYRTAWRAGREILASICPPEARADLKAKEVDLCERIRLASHATAARHTA